MAKKDIVHIKNRQSNKVIIQKQPKYTIFTENIHM